MRIAYLFLCFVDMKKIPLFLTLIIVVLITSCSLSSVPVVEEGLGPLLKFENQQVHDDIMTIDVIGKGLTDVAGMTIHIEIDSQSLSFIGAEKSASFSDFIFTSNGEGNNVSLALASAISKNIERESIATLQFKILKQEKTVITASSIELLDSKSNPILVKGFSFQIVY